MLNSVIRRKSVFERTRGRQSRGVRRNEVTMVVTKYSLIGAILQYYPSAEQCFNEMGMHCVSCHMSPRETLEQACQTHQCDVEELIAKLDKHING